LNVETSNKYSDKKIVWRADKLEALRTNVVTPPLYVRIKPTNLCCHGCRWCIYNSPLTNANFKALGMHDTVNQKSILSREKILEVLSDLKDMGVKCTTYSGGGEPLMHPNIEEIFAVTKEYGIGLSIITNGQLLSGGGANELCEADWVRISMDYCDASTFSQSRKLPEASYQILIDNIVNFASKKATSCDLTVNYIITHENHHKLYEAAVLLSGLGISNVRFSPVWINDYFKYHQSIKTEVLLQLDRAKQLETNTFKVYHNYKIAKDADVRTYHKCFIPQIIPAIGADYNVYNCHNKSYTTDAIIGSIKDQSFKQMWFSPQTKKHFEEFDAQKCCRCQCANDPKNILIHELIDCYGDDYV
jgi:MoaA/NifB/PqqE/SkfB family radical SAM enzyme